MTERLGRADVLRRREATQRLTTPGLSSAAEVVRLLGCVQSQEWAHGFWSLGMRTAGLDEVAVRAEFDAGYFLRTHILRPTWHFVAPEDLGWMLRVTAPRVHRLNAGVYRSQGLDGPTLERTAELVCTVLQDQRYLTRAEIGVRLVELGVQRPSGSRLAHIMMYAELEGLVCSGPIRGAQHTYALTEERVGPVGTAPDDPVAELLLRYVAGHGPTTVQDFCRWSSLTQTVAREALDRVSSGLCSADVDGLTVWWHPNAPTGPEPGAVARLVPLYDELTLSYPKINYSLADGHPHRAGDDLYVGSVIVDQRNVGLWRRTVKGPNVVVALDLAPGVTATELVAVDAEVERLAAFLGKALVREGSAA